MRNHYISRFDRFGIAVVSTLGLGIGLLIASAYDIGITPTLAIIVPGMLIGVAFARVFGNPGAAIACGIANGVVYGLLLYGWYRVAGALQNALPRWFGSAGKRLSRLLD
jgi:hypothetical protein